MRKFLLVLMLFASSAFADPKLFSVSPNSGPADGGTEVIIKGDYGNPATVEVFFGSRRSPSARLVNTHTITAVTPPHLAGVVRVGVRLDGIGANEEVAFTFEGESAAFERVLLPTFTAPVRGAFGSEFWTDLRLANRGSQDLEIYGLRPIRNVIILDRIWQLHDPVIVPPIPAATAEPRFEPFSSPEAAGRFVYVARRSSEDLVAQLRVFDVTRDAHNFGTEVPVVREREFFTHGDMVFLGVPRDPLFRVQLRIYSTQAITVTVRVDNEVHVVPLTPGANIFEPASASFTNFPITGDGTGRVIIGFPPPSVGSVPLTEHPPAWAMISVTNNQTHAITTISPQR